MEKTSNIRQIGQEKIFIKVLNSYCEHEILNSKNFNLSSSLIAFSFTFLAFWLGVRDIFKCFVCVYI